MISSPALRRIQLDCANQRFNSSPVQAVLQGYTLAAASTVLLLGPAFTVNIGTPNKVEMKHVSADPQIAARPANPPVAAVSSGDETPALKSAPAPTAAKKEGELSAAAKAISADIETPQVDKHVVGTRQISPEEPAPITTPHISQKPAPLATPHPATRHLSNSAKPQADTPFEAFTPPTLPAEDSDGGVSFEMASPQ